jgi:hypothetical protein
MKKRTRIAVVVCVAILIGLGCATFRRKYFPDVYSVVLGETPARVIVTTSYRPGFDLGGIDLLPFSGDFRYDVEVDAAGKTQTFSMRNCPTAIWTDRDRLYVVASWPGDWMMVEVKESGECVAVPVAEWDKMLPRSARWNLVENREDWHKTKDEEFELSIQ